MAHFALVEAGTVKTVNAVCNCAIGGCMGEANVPAEEWNPAAHETCGTLEFPDTEPLGQAMLADAGFTGEWLQCSYSGSFRGAYPGQGWTYDAEFDEFIPPAAPEETPAP